MALLEVKPSGHWSTHSPPNNEYPEAHVIQLVAKEFLLWTKNKKRKKRKKRRKEEKEVTRSTS